IVLQRAWLALSGLSIASCRSGSEATRKSWSKALRVGSSPKIAAGLIASHTCRSAGAGGSPTAPYVDIAGPVADLSRTVPDPCLLRIPERRPVLDLLTRTSAGRTSAEPARRQLHDRVTGSKKGRP